MLDQLPHLNAALNASAAVLLMLAYAMIRRGRRRAHAALMISAVCVSALFLIGYLAHKAHAGEQSTRTMHWIPGWLRTIYLAILFPHLVLAMGMLPMIGMTLYRAYRQEFDRHRRIARPTFAIWLFVSVTGVIIYFMLYHLFPAMRSA